MGFLYKLFKRKKYLKEKLYILFTFEAFHYKFYERNWLKVLKVRIKSFNIRLDKLRERDLLALSWLVLELDWLTQIIISTHTFFADEKVTRVLCWFRRLIGPPIQLSLKRWHSQIDGFMYIPVSMFSFMFRMIISWFFATTWLYLYPHSFFD